MRQFLSTLALLVAAAPLAAQPARPAKDTANPKLWVNYDFVPGTRVLYYNDFSEDVVGNFPKRLGFKVGNMEVAELDGQRYLRATAPSVFTIPLPEVLPARFTIEMDVINRKSLDGVAFQLQGTLLQMRDAVKSSIVWGAGGAGCRAAAAARLLTATTRRSAPAIAASRRRSASWETGPTSRCTSTRSAS